MGISIRTPRQDSVDEHEQHVAFTGFDRVDRLTQPLLVIAGSKAGSLSHSGELHVNAAGPKKVMGQRSSFFKRHLLEQAG